MYTYCEALIVASAGTDGPPTPWKLFWWFISTAGELAGNNFDGVKDFCAEYGSSDGQDLALTAVCVPSLLDPRMRQEVHPDKALTGLFAPISLHSGSGFHRVYEG